MILAEILKQPGKFDCLKRPDVLYIEELQFSWFHLITLLIFACAVIHTLSAHKIHALARALELPKKSQRSLFVQLLYFLSEVEVVFVFWAIPLLLTIACFFSWETAFEYINTRDYTEALFVFVILALTATRPILRIAEVAIHWVAKALGGSLAAWWVTLLTIGPIFGSFITEAGSMALSALLLSKQFYEFHPSSKLAYATLALLFVNVSIGGVLTNFASPAALILSNCWKWSTWDMFVTFGWKAVLGIIVSNFLYWVFFRKELALLNERRQWKQKNQESQDSTIPYWITIIHVLSIVWIVSVSHYPALFIASFLFFIGFHQATREHQYPIRLARPMLVGLFLAGLVIHGGLQGWWVADLLSGLSPLAVMGVSILLTAFNDNAAISYLATLIPNWGTLFQYAIFTGALAGGGLTVIGNAPNPAGYSILNRHFEGGIRPTKLFVAALLPTFVLYALYYFLGPLF